MKTKARLTDGQLGSLDGILDTLRKIEQSAQTSDSREARNHSRLLELGIEIFLLKCGLEISSKVKRSMPLLVDWPYAPETAAMGMTEAERQKLTSFVAYCLFCGDAAAIAHHEALQEQVDGCHVWLRHWLAAMGYELRKTERHDRWIIRDNREENGEALLNL